MQKEFHKSHIDVLSRLALFTLLLLLTSESLSAAVTNQWINAASSIWSATTNWSAGVLPSTSFDFTVISNAGTKTVTADAGAPVASLALRSLVVSAPNGSTNTLLLSSLPATMTTSRAVSIERGGVLEISNSTFTPQSTFDITSGTLLMDSGLLDTSGLQIGIRVGRASGATGKVTLNGGTVKCFGFRLGELSGSSGSCTVQGGTLWSTSVLDMGEIVNSPGSLTNTSGQIIVTNDITRVGNLATGQFNQSGGTSSFSFWSIADNAPGTANISGGLVTITPGGPLDVTRIGNFDTGNLNISGGTVWARGQFHVADNPGIQGSVLMTGGLLLATNDLVAIGRYGIGDMTVTNATAYFTNTSVGRHTDATGTLTIQNGGSIFCVDDVSIGRFTNSTGTINLMGGLLSLTNDSIWVGREGSGTLTVSGGILKARAVYSGMSEDGTNTPSGTMTISGGTVLLSSNLMVGTSLVSTGQVNFVGGLLAVTNANGSGAVNVVQGMANLNGGVLITDQVILTNGAGTFSFASGSLQARNMTIANGAPFVVGDGVQPATLQLAGGIYSFADGLVISSNAIVSGCGTIIGAISNNGTLSTNCNSAPVVLISAISRQDSAVKVSFSTASGSSYTLEYKNSLTDPVWTAITPPIVGSGGVTNIVDPGATNNARFYRIHLQ
jgi:fibronectin-binding autotransporter adhesin